MSESQFDLKSELKAIGMSQKDFAILTNVHVNSVSRWIRGELETPKWVSLLLKYYKKAKLLEELSITIK